MKPRPCRLCGVLPPSSPDDDVCSECDGEQPKQKQRIVGSKAVEEWDGEESF